MSYRIAGIDVHKKMLAVVVSDVEIESEYQFERRMFSSNPEQLRSLAAWLVERKAEEIVMESTAQYWKPGVSWRGPACGVVFPFAISTSICRSSVMICSGL